jgi:hypothetical protein
MAPPIGTGGDLMSELLWASSRQHRELVATVESAMPAAVDELHVAAALESRGISDQTAREKYGRDDVFALATAVYRDLPEKAANAERRPVEQKPLHALRMVAHGPLYALPSAVYPAVFTTLGAVAIVRGMLFATALGWVWGMGMSAVAYQLRGQGRERAAASAMRLLGVAGLGLALVGVGVLVLLGWGGPGMAAFVVAQMAFQLCSGVLVFYRKELWLAALMAPAFVTGVVHITSGYAVALVVPTLVAGAVSALLIAGAAWWASVRGAAGAEPDPPGGVVWSRSVRGAMPSICYAVLGAWFLLFTDSRFIIGQFDLAIAVAPLVVGMGTVEWRAHRFRDQAVELLHRDATPMDFRRDVGRLVLRELMLCLLVLGGLAALLLTTLSALGMLSGDGAVLAEAHVVLGGAFFLGFVLARHEQFTSVLWIFAAVVVGNVIAVEFLAPHLGSSGLVQVFLLSTSTLLVLLLARLRVTAVHVYHYR